MTNPIQRAQIVVPCSHFDATFAALTAQLGFRVEVIFPADEPSTAVVSGYGVTLRLESAAAGAPPITLRLLTSGTPAVVVVPDVAIEWVLDDVPPALPTGTQEFVITRADDADAWVTGRAGMQYRDLIPGRLGGRFVASHIRIPDGGLVPDYVHFHKIRFQMIFCKAGWVRVVYEDQGEPFVLHAGDCVLQPPQIRHRVLDASAGLEVIEVGCPAIHETIADHHLRLPTARLEPMRDFSGQRFVRHIAAESTWFSWMPRGRPASGFDVRDTGIRAATAGLAYVSVVRATSRVAATQDASHDGELLFMFVLSGALHLRSAVLGEYRLGAGDSVTIPAGADLSLRGDIETQFLEVAIPVA